MTLNFDELVEPLLLLQKVVRGEHGGLVLRGQTRTFMAHVFDTSPSRRDKCKWLLSFCDRTQGAFSNILCDVCRCATSFSHKVGVMAAATTYHIRHNNRRKSLQFISKKYQCHTIHPSSVSWITSSFPVNTDQRTRLATRQGGSRTVKLSMFVKFPLSGSTSSLKFER